MEREASGDEISTEWGRRKAVGGAGRKQPQNRPCRWGRAVQWGGNSCCLPHPGRSSWQPARLPVPSQTGLLQRTDTNVGLLDAAWVSE